MADIAMERLSRMGADASFLRREIKRDYEHTLSLADAVDVKMESPESPLKKHLSEKFTKGMPKTPKHGASSTSAAAKKKAARQSHEVAELQGVVDGIQQQVDAASKGIQELKQLVNAHLMGPTTATADQWMDDNSAADNVTCVSPPASLLALDQDDAENELAEFAGYQQNMLAYYGSDPLPFSC